LLAACTRDAPQNFLHPVGPIAKKEDALWRIVFPIAAVIFVLVEGALVFAIFKFRERPGGEPAQFHGNTKLEVILTLIPSLLLAGVGVVTVRSLIDLSHKPTGDVLNVRVIAHQWWWEYRYPDDGVIAANELHIPVGRPVYFTLESQDVIHSFWVPKLGGKQDVVPGRQNHLTLIADRPGEYWGQCAEFCGLSHANMRLRVVAQPADQFAAWVSAQNQPAATPGAGLAAEGAKIFATGSWPKGACSGCHTVNGTTAQGQVGPNLTHFASRARFAGYIYDNNPENVAAWLNNPPERKPGSIMPRLGLSQDEINALVAYLESLK
jgi:cytochrome c oxidase subunit 2